MFRIMGAAFAASLVLASQAMAADAPSEIKIGTLYASSGRFASISMPVHSALKLWVEQKNADGGVYVKAFDKKIPIKLVAYDDQSNTATASTLYNQLITQDKVDLLVADSGSVLTAPAVAIARDHKMFLFDQTGTGASFFSKDNPYIALMADPVSTVWPKPVADFISHDGPAPRHQEDRDPLFDQRVHGHAGQCLPQIRERVRVRRSRSSTTRASRPRPRTTTSSSTTSAIPTPTR